MPCPRLLLALCLVFAACAPAASDLDVSAGPQRSSASRSVLRSEAVPPTTSPPPTSGVRVFPDDLDAMAFQLTESLPDGTGAGGGDPEDPADPGQPVTTLRGPTDGSTALYRGVVASLDPSEQVIQPVAGAPLATAGVMPLTGLPGQVPDRPAIVVKIDNSPPARPQSGLNAADVVVEEEVEGGLTRFAAIFHSRTSTVGPVRSGRTTDLGVLASLGQPLFVYSGANSVTDSLIRRQDYIQNRSFDTSSGFWRSPNRRAPSNLYTELDRHWETAEGAAPPAMFEFRTDIDDGGDRSGGDPGEVEQITVRFRANRVTWEWAGAAWLRRQGGEPHLEADGDQVSAANVLVMEANEVSTGMVDGAGSPVPEFVLVGTGPVTVFTGGRQIDGTWTRPTLDSVATITDARGNAIPLTPGRTWIEVLPADTDRLEVE
ncbi:MAG: DUF3048 domain-containing protein [Actinomycetota bacterium]